MQASKLRNILMITSMTALPLALCAGFAEARGVGITHLAAAKETVMAGRGHAAASSAASPAAPVTMAPYADAGCYETISRTEAVKGIRHWRPVC
jgi:hypothetical protein